MKSLFVSVALGVSPLTPQIVSYEKTCSLEVNGYLKTLNSQGRRKIKSAVTNAVRKSSTIRKETYYTKVERDYRMRPRLQACRTTTC